MSYAEGRIVHDADSHVMETPDWLISYADPEIRPRLEPLSLTGCKPGEESFIDELRRRRRDPADRAEAEAKLMIRKNWSAMGSFLREDRPRALDLLGFSSQLVFNTFLSDIFVRYERSRDVEIRLSGDLPKVDVSAAAFELCLSNLLANAIKYSDPRKEKRWVEIRAAVTSPADTLESETVVEVRDNGLGVPEAKRSRLFERGFRAHEETQSGIDGTGLGLSIVRETVAAMGGRAWADFLDEGTTFFFSMPTRRAEDEAQTVTTATPSATGSDGQSAEDLPR